MVRTATKKQIPEDVLDDVAFIKNPDQWPNYPLLPVKKYEGGGPSTCGIIGYNDLTTVRALNMFIGWTPEQYDAAQTWTYETVEALITDGWMVD